MEIIVKLSKYVTKHKMKLGCFCVLFQHNELCE